MPSDDDIVVTCWRCGFALQGPSSQYHPTGPWEPICDDCYPLAVIESEARNSTPGVRCHTCVGAWGKTYHPASRPCMVLTPEQQREKRMSEAMKAATAMEVAMNEASGLSPLQRGTNGR